MIFHVFHTTFDDQIFLFSLFTQSYGSLYQPEHEYFEEPKDKQNLHKIPGVPGVDYPLYHEVPPTSFTCSNVPALPGMYANVETGCQV